MCGPAFDNLDNKAIGVLWENHWFSSQKLYSLKLKFCVHSVALVFNSLFCVIFLVACTFCLTLLYPECQHFKVLCEQLGIYEDILK